MASPLWSGHKCAWKRRLLARLPRALLHAPSPTTYLSPTSTPGKEADEDGSGELDPDEFYEQLGPYLGQGLSTAAVSQLFMRIDADCGGTIDWQVRP